MSSHGNMIWNGNAVALRIRSKMRTMRHAALNGHLQLLQSNRLGDIVVHASIQTNLSIAFHGMGGHGNDVGLVACCAAYAPRRLEDVHLRQLHIHQHNDI